jgi:hypothetical protein
MNIGKWARRERQDRSAIQVLLYVGAKVLYGCKARLCRHLSLVVTMRNIEPVELLQFGRSRPEERDLAPQVGNVDLCHAALIVPRARIGQVVLGSRGHPG